ncbi:VOC family protein [Actinacidiphila acidipaludis]|uniref:VOC family protein n=1 Tax=Actinacidiphila acidipaludis TaxID=2873382 RepID=A0ABS7QF67_9ACTN|nr:VOC family protein [Streptomyces acidipaludis]MBY8881085.1 VOC family protein [Streptomyces acidipaludis]
MASTPRAGHIGISVTDLAVSRAFYQEVLGFELIAEDPARGHCFLGHAGQVVLTLWQQADEPFAHTRAGLHHLAFEVDSLADVVAAQSRVRALGARFVHEGVVAHAEGASSGGIFFRDPDGTRLEIYAPAGVEAEAPHGEAPTCGFF